MLPEPPNEVRFNIQAHPYKKPACAVDLDNFKEMTPFGTRSNSLVILRVTLSQDDLGNDLF